MTSKLIDWLFGRNTGEEPVQMVTSNPDEVGQALTAARLEIQKLRGDREFIENRLREEIEGLRADCVGLRKDLANKDERIQALLTDVEKAEASAAEEAREQIRRAGHEPAALEKDPEASETIIEQYRAMSPGAERNKFYQLHKADLEKHFGPARFNVKIR